MLVRDCVLVKDFKRRQVVIKELTAKVWLCLLCKEKPEELTRTKLLGHLTNNHFSKELAKDFGAVEEGSECTFCVQDQKTSAFKINLK